LAQQLVLPPQAAELLGLRRAHRAVTRARAVLLPPPAEHPLGHLQLFGHLTQRPPGLLQKPDGLALILHRVPAPLMPHRTPPTQLWARNQVSTKSGQVHVGDTTSTILHQPP